MAERLSDDQNKTEVMTPTFKQVGPSVEPGDVRISSQEAELFRKTALKGTKIQELEIGDFQSHVWAKSYATGVLSTADADYGVDESGVFSKTSAGPSEGYVRSVMNFVRYNSERSDTKIYNIFEVHMRDGDVLSAVRRVRVIRNLMRTAFDDKTGEPYEDLYSEQRKMFEVPMESEDVALAALKVERIMNRQRVTRTPPSGRLRPAEGYVFTPL